jgi:hypothetical protein
MARVGLALALLLAAAPLVGAPAADASTTRIDGFSDGKGRSYAHVNYFGAAGEANRLTVGLAGTNRWVFDDLGAQIAPSEGCPSTGQRAECTPFGDTEHVFVYLDDGDDELTVPTATGAGFVQLQAHGSEGRDVLRATGEPGQPFVTFSGGAGDDELSTTRAGSLQGGDGDDRALGSRLSDFLGGGPGSDTLTGGEGDDSLAPGEDTDRDVVDGGPGRDTVSYGSGDPNDVAPRTIDLEAGTAAPGDELRSIEGASGGGGPDVLRGSPRADELVGGPGGDALDGGAGDDNLIGADGDDRIAGGAGGDSLTGSDGRDELAAGPGDDRVDPWQYDFRDDHEDVSCGSGRDVLFLPEVYRDVAARFRTVPADCELIDAQQSRLGRFRARPRIDGGAASWSLLCVRAAFEGRCPVTFELRGGGRSFGSGTISLRAGRRGTLTVPLNEAGRRRARGGGALEVGIRIKSRFGSWSSGRVHRFQVGLPAAH